MPGKRDLTEEENALWEQAMAGVTTMEPAAKRVPRRVKSLPLRTPAQKQSLPDDFRLPHYTAPKEAGMYDGIDKNTATRFKRGKYAASGTLDLHGMTQAEAYRALHGFLHAHAARGSRCVIIITGKGKRAVDGQEAAPGVLKKAFPAWLATDALAPLILAFDTAQQKHGGSGAFYVLLRRKKG